jgi:CubicO group peptidase (beta-lactamase class C family)
MEVFPRRAALLFTFALAMPSWAQERLDSALRQAVADGLIVGAQAYVGQGDEVLLDAVYGRVRPDRNDQVDAQTLFCIGSVSKPLASTIVLGLAEEGKLDVDVPVSRYLPAFDRLPKPPTLRQLLAHRGGIYTQRRQMSGSQVRWIRDFTLTLAEAVDGIAGEELGAEPGETFAYSGAGYCVLGRAVEVAAKKDFETLLQRRLAKPLSWKRTTYFPSTKDQNVATGADASGAAHPETPHLQGKQHRLALVGGSVYSTARELAGFGRAMTEEGKGLLPAAAFDRVVRQPFPGEPYGLGWALTIPEGEQKAASIRHNGALAASRATLIVDLAKGRYTAVVYSVAGKPGEAERRVRDAVAE